MVQDPGRGPQIGGYGLQLRVGRIQGDGLSLVNIAVCGGQEVGFIVHGIGPLPNQIFMGHVGGKGGDEDKAQKAEQEIAQDKLGVQGMCHRYIHSFRFAQAQNVMKMVA